MRHNRGRMIWLCSMPQVIGVIMRRERINPRPDGGGGGKGPPCWFFANNSNSVGNSALKFFSTSPGINSTHPLKKKLSEVTQGQKL